MQWYWGGIIAFVGLAAFPVAFGDTVQFQSGSSVDCIVLQENDHTVTILRDYSILRFPRSVVADTSRAAPDARETPASSARATRFPDYRALVLRLATQQWATDLRQIPATVIDVGVMRNVPYKSHRAGRDYEINVYGDPDSPAGFEIGIRGGLLADHSAKANCVDFVRSLLPDANDKSAVTKLKLDKDLVTRDGLTFEVTPTTDEDSYGGWWVSTYSTRALDAVRASEKEIQAISIPKTSIPRATSPTSSSGAPSSTEAIVERSSQWNPADLNYARPARQSAVAESDPGRVYVRGYYRKSGTYVQSHTRSR